MQIGDIQLDSNLILAPMAGVTDLAFRKLCREFGAGLAVSEMITSDVRLNASRKTASRLHHEGETAPVSVQIVGNEPEKMAQAAKRSEQLGAHIIDINMGCPAKKVCKKAAGSALMRDEKLVRKILQATVDSVDIPVTLKIRTGWDEDHKNALHIAKIAEQSGIKALSIHGRTRAEKFSGNAEYETIKEVKSNTSIPVIANGDIDTPKKAKQVLQITGADGIMVGRAAQGRPWLFREIKHFLDSGKLLPPPEPDWVKSVLLDHLDGLYALYGEMRGVQIARKHIAWYSKAQRGANEFRKTINQVATIEQQKLLIEDFFDRQIKGEIAA